MSTDIELVLTVRRASEASSLQLEQSFIARAGQVIGRRADADILLNDPTVSRRHVEVLLAGDKLALRNVSRNNGLFIDQAEVPPGQAAPLDGERLKVQVGGVLFDAVPSAPTRPVSEPITHATLEPPARVATAAARWLELTVDGDACTARVADHHLDISRNAAMALVALCRTPGRVVHEWDIQNEMGVRCHIPPLMSAIRRALLSLLQQGVIGEGDIRLHIARTTSGAHVRAASQLTGAALLRRFVVARRGHGYAIMLPAEQVVIRDAG